MFFGWMRMSARAAVLVVALCLATGAAVWLGGTVATLGAPTPGPDADWVKRMPLELDGAGAVSPDQRPRGCELQSVPGQTFQLVQRWGLRCATPYGWCWLPQPRPLGAPCFCCCPVDYGYVIP